MLKPHFSAGIFLAGLTSLGACLVSAQDFPNRPIRIVTAAPGGGNDAAARIIAQGITGPLGQSVIVENRPSLLAKEIAAKAQPDGYTLTVVGNLLWTGPLLQGTAYDPLKEFSPISLVASRPFILVEHPSVPANSVKEMIALAKAKPGSLVIAGTTPGSDGHLAAELLKSMAGINITVVPYTGGGPALIGLLGGQAQLLFSETSTIVPHVKTGKVKVLAVSSLQSSTLYPGIPPVAATLPGFEIVGITGIYAPVKTPAAVINKLNREVVRYLKSPDGTEKFLAKGDEVIGSTPEELTAKIKSTVPKYAKLIKDTGIKGAKE